MSIKSYIALGPITCLLVYLGTLGMTARLADPCAEIVRSLGHVGIGAVFVVGAFLQNTFAQTFTGCISLCVGAFSPKWWMQVCFVYAGIALLHNRFRAETAMMTCTLLWLPIESIELEDLFPFAGHVALMSAFAYFEDSFAFLLSASLSAVFITTRFDWTYALGAWLALAHFCSRWRRPIMLGDDEIWSATHLYSMPSACFCSAMFTVYVLSIVWTLLACEMHGTMFVLYAGHVGAIFALIVFILPQTSEPLFGRLRALSCTAASVDAVLSLTKGDEIIFLVRGVFAGASALTLAYLSSCDQYYMHNDRRDSKRIVHYARLVCIIVYISLTFVNYAFDDDVFLAFANLSHFCFLIGGLGIESILRHDLLKTRLFTTFILFECGSLMFLPWNPLSLRMLFACFSISTDATSKRFLLGTLGVNSVTTT